MAYAEYRAGGYWRGRFRLATGKYETVKDATGATVRFRTRRDAEKAANDAEARVRANAHRDPAAGRETFGEYATRWFALQDLAASTMQTYRHHIEVHLLPTFQDVAVGEIRASDVAAWEKRERAAGYAEKSIGGYRRVLHLILADAVDEGLRETNPAAQRRGRGKRAGRSQNRAPEKAVTSPVGVVLLAERAALLSGRDDEFVSVVLMGFTGIRWGEVVGLESQYVRPGGIRIEWQIYELDTGELLRCPPKDDSYRTIATPTWLDRVMAAHLARVQPAACDCHGLRYAFRGHGPTPAVRKTPGVRVVDVAERAGVSTGTVSAVLNRPATVPEVTRARVAAAITELGYVRGLRTEQPAAHWRRNNFAGRVFQPAVTGRFVKKGVGGQVVPVVAEPFPGIPVRGRGAVDRSDGCWTQLGPALTPHSLRHGYKTLMEELGIPSKLMDAQMGHSDGSVQAGYSHVTPLMRERLLDGLTEAWLSALDARLAYAPRSPVAVLDRLLVERAAQ